jgi:hypothetical protein
MAKDSEQVIGENFIHRLPQEVTLQILNYLKKNAALYFLSSCQSFYKNDQFWQSILSSNYGIVAQDARLILRHIHFFEKYKTDQSQSNALVTVLNALEKAAQAANNQLSIFLAEAYLFGYGYEKNIQLALPFLEKAIVEFSENKNIHSFFTNRLSYLIEHFQNEFVTFVIDSEPLKSLSLHNFTTPFEIYSVSYKEIETYRLLQEKSNALPLSELIHNQQQINKFRAIALAILQAMQPENQASIDEVSFIFEIIQNCLKRFDATLLNIYESLKEKKDQTALNRLIDIYEYGSISIPPNQAKAAELKSLQNNKRADLTQELRAQRQCTIM